MTEALRSISRCRICGNDQLVGVCDLGTMAFTGVFPRTIDEVVPRGPLTLVRCQGNPDKTCGLVQLAHSFDPKVLFAEGYGYRSGINHSMRDHLAFLARKIEGMGILKAGDAVLDIGSNDGTFLNNFIGQGLFLAGVDPLAGKFRSSYAQEAHIVPDFFSLGLVREMFSGRRPKVITAIAMFYDLDDPTGFLMEAYEVLADDGILVLELSYWPDLMRLGAYDTICHEHLGYYGLRQIEWLAGHTGFKIIDAGKNSVNGSSFFVVMVRDDARPYGTGSSVEALRRYEVSLASEKPDHEFSLKVNEHRDRLCSQVRALNLHGVRVAGYGASTKGNVLLQFCGLTDRDILFVAEINQDKWGHFCPGSRIPIIDERQVRTDAPGAFLVLPWHLKDSILAREVELLSKGVQFVFPFELA